MPPTDDWFGNRAPERAQALLNSGAEVCEKLKGADLVTVQLGINDVAGAVISALKASGWLDLSKLTNVTGIDGVSSYVTSSLAEAGSPIRIPAKVGGRLMSSLP